MAYLGHPRFILRGVCFPTLLRSTIMKLVTTTPALVGPNITRGGCRPGVHVGVCRDGRSAADR